MSERTRERRPGETPRIGDVVQIFDGAFGTAILTAHRYDGYVTYWTVERPHVSCSSTGETRPAAQFCMMAERFELSTERVCALPVYVTGASGNVDNRLHTP